MDNEPMPGAVRQDNWFVLLDPDWPRPTPWSSPPPAVIVGGWMLDNKGDIGPFQPNPHFAPIGRSTPSDPTDAVLRLIAEGADAGDQLVPTLSDSVVEIGCDDHDNPLIGAAPDGVPCVPVVTAELHKQRLEVQYWRPIVGSTLPDVVPIGTDILLNPGDRAQFRLITDALRQPL